MRVAAVAVSLALLCSTAGAVFGCGQQPQADSPTANASVTPQRSPAGHEWTVMVYMNGKNNLEPDAIANFLQMSEVGSSDAVNVVVEFGRPKKHYTDDYGAWSKTLRFKVEKGMEPTEDKAVMSVGDVDMGKGKQLVDFVAWARSKYPAKKYMLVVWDHGQGWRFKNSRNFELRARAARASVEDAVVPADEAPRAPYRSISNDDDFGTVLYNRDMQDSLAGLLKGERLDVIGFDACLMAMLETAYAMRGLTHYVVASEELEPGTGWNYRRWLTPLVAKPAMNASELAAAVVEAYKAEYGDIYMTTLSALAISNLPPLVESVNTLSSALSDGLAQDRAAIRTARRQCRPYGTAVRMTNPIDIGCFVDAIGRSTQLAKYHERARAVRAAVTGAVSANYASRRMTTGFGSFGVSFYFPTDLDDHRKDPDHSGYESGNVLMPVEYVHKERWAPFLWRYLELQSARFSGPTLEQRTFRSLATDRD
jgi:hypothetical protein